MRPKRAPIPNPLEAPEFTTIRLLQRAFLSGGIPPLSMQTAEDEARIAAFFVLHQLMHILEQFREACAWGERVRLMIHEHGRSPTRIVLEIAILRGEEGP